MLYQFAGQYIKDAVGGMKRDISLFLQNRQQEIEVIKKSIENMSPENVLKRGYSITLHNGRAVSSVKQVNKDDIINTIVTDGQIKSTVNNIQKSGK